MADGMRMVPTFREAMRRVGLTPEQQKRVNDRSLRTITAYILQQIQKAFTTSGQGQPGGKPWNDLTPDYLADKISEGHSPLMGVREGLLKRTQRSDLHLGRGKSETGSPQPHAPYFQKDRPFLPVESFIMKHWQSIHVGLWKGASVGTGGLSG